MLVRYLRFFCLFATFFAITTQAASVEKYLPAGHNYKNEILKPTESLGFGIGERHVRHDQLLNYLETITEQSERIQLTEMGRTQQLRKQILLTISSPENLSNLDNILAARSVNLLEKNDDNNGTGEPLVIWLGYSVHGDEISGANAAMIVAYHLAASQEEAVEDLLENTIIVIEPSLNPDGMDRFVNWVSTHRGTTPNSDPNHIEHHQGWKTGRTNHFGFDLNRDWLLLSQKESINRVAYFHRYQPNVLGDFHEMGANGSYFFQPGIPSRTHPLTPKKNTELTQLLATYHASALDKSNRLYYSEESYDDFYYGKGSTYPDINGGIGILFEQASSRGMQQATDNGLLTFEYGIQNHVFTSLSTIEGAWKNSDKLKNYRRDFYKQSENLAKKEKFSGYLISEDDDKYRLEVFLSKLKQHQINVYPLTEDFRLEGKVFSRAHSYYVPLAQPKYRLIKALFGQGTNFQDNTFYDVSGWTMPLAMNLEFHQVGRTWGLKLADNVWSKPPVIPLTVDENAYAYAFEWHHFMSPKLLNELLNKNIQVKVATKPFTAIVAGVKKQFKTGTVIVPAGIQVTKDWRKNLITSSYKNAIELDALSTGLTIAGIDLGSRSLKLLTPIKVLLVGGKGVSQYEAAEILFYLDDTLNIPVTVVEKQRLSRIDLSQYSHVIMVDGDYSDLSIKDINKVTTWVKQGGVIFGQKRAAKWLSEKEILKVKFASKEQIEQMFDTDNLLYKDKEALAGRKRIAGAIFDTSLDISHPIAYGYNNEKLPLFRNSTLIMDFPSSPFVAVATYTAAPLMSGYTDQTLVNRLANNAAIVAHNVGHGRVIATSDNLAFRGYWHGSAKILANSVFFAKVFSTPMDK